MPLSRLILTHREAIKAIVTAKQGKNPRELGFLNESPHSMAVQVNLFIEPTVQATWKHLADMEEKLGELLGVTVAIYATPKAVSSSALASAQPL